MILANSRNIAGVTFNGSGNIDIPYTNLTNKLSQVTGITISAVTPPVISATYTSGNLISIFNSTQIENVSSVIQIKSSFKPTNAVHEDTATKLATIHTISVTDFGGMSNISIDYNGQVGTTYKTIKLEQHIICLI
jgi:hypothetical protein